ncbi:hypothetical protein [Sphingomonas sp. OK281]|uniref:hypothetical protein n=1 Tax=Sphingomonas sp. OK281 TaxID=1881067 RepID=UPI0008E5BADA|nr:hypothetical protein [Sphingomonas sp. OK281]SFO02437.1 hypothetical protein SAMN05428984_1690 [Sphingomonas sp. OK281]
MSRVPEVVLFDMDAEVAVAEDMLFGANAPLVIDPSEAMSWIATGSFSEVVGLKKWTEFREESLGWVLERSAGRSELAEEIVIAGIASGRVRCVFVTEDAKDLPRLAYADPAIFEGKELSHEWENGLTLQVYRDDDDEDYLELKGFWFFWEDILTLTPRRPTGAPDTPSPSIPTATSATAPTSPMPVRDNVPPPIVSRSHSHDPAARRGRGRPAGKNGEPIAMFVLRVQAEGIDVLDGLSDDALGAMLKEEYLRLGLNLPENTNAARDARGVMRALVKMQAKMVDRQEA